MSVNRKKETSQANRKIPILGRLIKTRQLKQRSADVISGSIGNNAQGVAIGKNIIVIGSIKIPLLPLLILLVVVVVALAFLGLRMLGPDKMTGSFNLAVADFSQLDSNGHAIASAKGDLVSRRLFEGLKIELDNLPPTERANFHPQVWHDSLDFTQKRTKIGRIPGSTPKARWDAACALARKINANVMIYGDLPTEGSANEFLPEFAICDYASLRVDADEIVGAHQIIQGLPVQVLNQIDRPDAELAVNLQVNSWTKTLSLFSIGIMYDLQGRPDLALRVFQQAKDEINAGAGEVSEVLWFFIGREELTLAIPGITPPASPTESAAHLASAQTAFETALQLNPAYARAHIGLGGVYLDRAQGQPPTERFKNPDLAASLREYQQALADAPGSPGALIETKAHLALASAWNLEGEAHQYQGQFPEADTDFNKAIQAVKAALPDIETAQQIRLLAQAYLTLGEAYHDQGHLHLAQGDSSTSQDLFQKASDSYALCIQQKDAAFTDQTLRIKIVGDLCQQYKKVVDQSLTDLRKAP